MKIESTKRTEQSWCRCLESSTHLSELDVLLVDLPGGGGPAPAIDQPAPAPHQHHVRLLLRLRQAPCQRVAHLELQRASVGVNLNTQQFGVLTTWKRLSFGTV